MSGKIFISYRREDEQGYAVRLYERLAESFGRERLFFDVDTIPPGADFVEFIERHIAMSDIVLVVIGRDWLRGADASGRRRLDHPGDFVRIEIESALRLDKHVVPILVQGASMPRAKELPRRMQPLARRNAFHASHVGFKEETNKLTTSIRNVLAPSPSTAVDPMGALPEANASSFPVHPPTSATTSRASKARKNRSGGGRRWGNRPYVALALVFGALLALAVVQLTGMMVGKKEVVPEKAVVLGMQLTLIRAAQSARYGINRDAVLVEDVAPNSPAARARVEANTVLVGIGEGYVTTPQSAIDIVARLRSSGRTTINASYKTVFKDTQIRILPLF